MGGSTSTILSEEELNEYAELTYLSKPEILHILRRFRRLGPEVDSDRQHRYHHSKLVEAFPELKYNPFQDRIFRVFSSQKDDCFSFDDVLDLCSAFSDNCPVQVRAKWAFKLFDFDGDKQLNMDDIIIMLTRLTESVPSRSSMKEGVKEVLTEQEKKEIAGALMMDLDLDKTGGIAPMEFVHAISKIPEFSYTFRLKI